MTSQQINETIEEYSTKYPALITTGHAAQIANAPIGTIYDWSHRGLLDTFKCSRGRRVLFHRNDFIRWLMTSGQVE